MPSTSSTPKRRRLLIALGMLILALLLDAFLYPHLPMPTANGNRGRNGLWVRYTWYFGERSEADVQRLAGRLRDGQVRYAYCHVRYITPEGRLKFHYPAEARRLVEALHREAPGVQVLAWVYVGTERGTPTVDLGDPEVLRRTVDEARWLVQECGFDGIQWDYEVCANNDERLITLLRETRAALPDNFVSVCTPLWTPGPVTRVYGWDEAYFARVAGLCDQLAVMAYDTGMMTPRSYAWIVQQQVTHVTRAAAKGNLDCGVIIGVPTYGKGATIAHIATVETLNNALRGATNGTRQIGDDLPNFDGVAPFADYTTTKNEWAAYRRYWLGE